MYRKGGGLRTLSDHKQLKLGVLDAVLPADPDWEVEFADGSELQKPDEPEHGLPVLLQRRGLEGQVRRRGHRREKRVETLRDQKSKGCKHGHAAVFQFSFAVKANCEVVVRRVSDARAGTCADGFVREGE